ncbi:MAG: hypothetical protein DSZ29_03570 [Aquificaceae bacterium]|nr:MAG: hypothetical protein DSZ29_03570 [Aquificaceae bacterium]
MIKKVTVTTLFLTAISMTQLATAELLKPVADMSVTNKGHANVQSQTSQKAVGGHTNLQHWTQDQTKQAALEKEYKASILANPENKKTYAYLAGLYLSNNMSSKAINAYQEAIIHDPTNPKLFAAISIAYLHMAKYGMAKAMADQALKLDPKMTGVKKINEYVVAKQEAIKSASKIDSSKVNASKMPINTLSHGAALPTSAHDTKTVK